MKEWDLCAIGPGVYSKQRGNLCHDRTMNSKGMHDKRTLTVIIDKLDNNNRCRERTQNP